MLVHKYYIRPADEASENLALDEIARYVEARNRLLKLKRKWNRIANDQILPEFREMAAVYRATPRTGRKPTKERDDRRELQAADSRALYHEFVSAGGSYATWWLAQAAVKKAIHLVRDEYAGRAGMLPVWLKLEETGFKYCGTAWTWCMKMRQRWALPEAEMVQCWIQRERTSTTFLRKPRYKWFIVMVFDTDAKKHSVSASRGAAGLDIAWRQDDDTLRVGYVADQAGHHFPIRMTATQYSRTQHGDSLQSLADEDANRLRAELEVPQTTSYKRLIELAPDHPLTEHMIHLLEWRHGARQNVIASRDAHYRETIHKLCQAYHTIYVEKIKGTPALVQKKSTRKKKESESVQKAGVAREQRQITAPFMFLRALQAEASKFETNVVEIDGAYSSRICHACGCDMGASTVGVRTCSQCTQRWDVDHLAALNLLQWGSRDVSDETAAE